MAEGTTLGKAYVQILPSAEGIEGSITGILKGESENAGRFSGLQIVDTMKKIIVGGAIGKALSESVKAGGALEQSIGGIETLYKDASDTMIRYADNAFKTAGLSANDYMQTATTFAAGLVKSVGGDTAKAAEAANTAIIDMSDNANKMGTSMESIQNAYAGFAKQNYTMLDNLKLGYGGTKTEMQRLLADAEKLTGVHYDMENLNDVYSAIHVIQTELDITGTTAKEASTTIEGSINSLKGSWNNLLANLALGRNIDQSMNALVESAVTVAVNVGNALFNIAQSVPGAVVSLIQSIAGQIPGNVSEMVNSVVDTFNSEAPAFVDAAGEIVTNVLTTLMDSLPEFLEQGANILVNLTKGFSNNAPQLIGSLTNVVNNLLSYLMQHLPDFLAKGVEIILKIATGIIQSFPTVVGAMAQGIISILNNIVANLPQFLQKGIEMVGKIASGLIQAIPTVISSSVQIIAQLLQSFSSINWGNIGINIMQGIANGIYNMVGSVVQAAKNAASRIWNSITGFFGIHSPSRKMAWAGQMIDEGFAQGINNNADVVNSAVDDLNASMLGSLDTDGNIYKAIQVDADGIRKTAAQSLSESTYAGRYESGADKLAQLLKDGRVGIYIDKNTLVGTLITDIDNGLGTLSIRKERG